MEERSYPSLKRLVLGAPPIPDALSRAVAAFEVDPDAEDGEVAEGQAVSPGALPGAEDFSGGSVLDAWLAYGTFRPQDLAAVA